MGSLGIESEEERANQRIWDHGAGFYDARGDSILVLVAVLNGDVAGVSLH